MAKILAISSQVVFGPVGLSAIVPALQAKGHDVLALPTVLLSNHPGHGEPTGQAQDIAAIVLALEHINAFANLDAVIAGYFASPEQVHSAAALIKKLSPKIVLIDPVLGDHGKLYVPLAVAEAIRDKLVPLATICMPNAYELSWLTSHSIETTADAIIAARFLKLPEVIATSVPAGADLATMRITQSDVTILKNSLRQSVPNGTGDLLSGLYLARQFSGFKNSAFADSLDLLQIAIALSGATKILAIAQALRQRDNPNE